MSLLLYINGQQAELAPGQAIAQTRQVNDLNSLENRQASYTNKFKLPKTATNIKIMGMLSLMGNDSDIPYRKNECSLYGESGECFVYKGWAEITDGGEDFEVVIYDGIIDLYKAIENKNLSDLDLHELDHSKHPDTIIASWTQNKPYRYILADYNGNRGLPNTHGPFNQTPIVNADYLVPSVNVAWLWNKVFTTYGVGYEGSVFNTEEFKNLWMTYPKGLSPEDNGETLFESSNMGYDNSGNNNRRVYYIGYPGSNTVNNLPALVFNRNMMVDTAGYYRIEVSGKIRTVMQIGNIPFRLFLGKNTGLSLPHTVPVFATIGDNMTSDADFEVSKVVRLDSNDSVTLMLSKPSGLVDLNYFFSISGTPQLTVKFIKLDQDEYDFSSVFSGFSIRDFLKEVIQRFGLTLFKDKYANKYSFLTLQEQLNGAESEDWSGKFSRKLSERYVYGNYARRNWFRYKYNAEGGSHNDAYIDIANEMLAESKNIFASKMYSPEKVRTKYLDTLHNVYKLWDKETEQVTDDETNETTTVTKYKSLDNRYYLMRAEPLHKNIRLKSSLLEVNRTASNVWVESYWKLPFNDILQTYYKPVTQLLQKSLIVNTELYLTDADIANFDFKKLYYFEQLSGYFIMNKINNYQPGKPVKCEMAMVRYSPQDIQLPVPITITRIIISSYMCIVYYELTISPTVMFIEWSKANENNWQYSSFGVGPSIYCTGYGGQDYKVRLRATDQYIGQTYYTEPVPMRFYPNATIIP